MSGESAWAVVDAWAQRQARERSRLKIELLGLGWALVATDDGTHGARPLRRDDPSDVMWWEGEPEARGETPEILLATVRALREGQKGGGT